MCKGFGAIVDHELNVFFTAPDKSGDISHSNILSKLGWKDSENKFLRRFVRVECSDWTIGTLEFDEDETLPGWTEENTEAIKSLVASTLEKLAPAWAEYDRVSATAWAEYDRVFATAWAEYERVRATALAEYDRVTARAWADYARVRAPAWAEYERVRAPAWAEYERVSATALAEYDRVSATAWAEMLSQFHKVKGFIE